MCEKYRLAAQQMCKVDELRKTDQNIVDNLVVRHKHLRRILS